MKPRVAMLAYACDPEGAGEHWLGWGWAEQAAGFCELHLFVPEKNRETIERHAGRVGVSVHYVAIPTWKRKISERLGRLGSWWRKVAWAKLAAGRVAALHRQQSLDLVHQTTFHTFRVPMYAAGLGLPAVWGPMAGGEYTPAGFDAFLGAAAAAERSRARSNRWWLQWPGVQRALREARVLFVSNRTTLNFLPEWSRAKAVLIAPNTLRSGDEMAVRAPRPVTDTLSLFYVGNCVATRSIPLVLQALKRPELGKVRLVVAGTGPARDAWQTDVEKLGLSTRVSFVGQVNREQLAALYREADALVFPALRDAGGSALLEAMSLGVPVVCLDWAGPGEMLDEGSGIKVSVVTPEAAIDGLAAAFLRLQNEPELRVQLAERAAEHARTYFTWEAKRRLLESTYTRLLSPQ